MGIENHMQRLTINPQGWLANTIICQSSHVNPRPDISDVSLLVIHNISLPPGQFGGDYIDDLFMGRLDCSADPYFAQLQGLRVSAHCMINRLGIVTQYVSFAQRAWHAGLSSFEGRDNCNDFSIGIELEGTDEQPYTEQQYQALAALTTALINQYPLINRERIVGHCDIAPGRKSDPGEAFDWSHYFAMLG